MFESDTFQFVKKRKSEVVEMVSVLSSENERKQLFVPR